MGSDDNTITFASRNFLSSIEEGFGPLILPCSINLSTLYMIVMSLKFVGHVSKIEFLGPYC